MIPSGPAGYVVRWEVLRGPTHPALCLQTCCLTIMGCGWCLVCQELITIKEQHLGAGGAQKTVVFIQQQPIQHVMAGQAPQFGNGYQQYASAGAGHPPQAGFYSPQAQSYPPGPGDTFQSGGYQPISQQPTTYPGQAPPEARMAPNYGMASHESEVANPQ